MTVAATSSASWEPQPPARVDEATHQDAIKAVTGKANPMSWNIKNSKSEFGGRNEMPTMRLSLFYLAGYLLPVGLLLMFVPKLTMKLLLTNHSYDDLGLRLGGVFAVALGMVVISMILNRAAQMYSTTLFVRAFIITSLVVLFDIYRDPALLAITAVVTVGWVLTFLSWRRDTAAAR